MKTVRVIVLCALAVSAPAFSSGGVPALLVGKWSVGVPYATPGPVGIDANQEKFIRKLQLTYTTGQLRVCGKEIPIQAIDAKSLDSEGFLQEYRFPSHTIGIDSSPITDITINPSGGMNACGEYADPGVHLLIGSNGHVVMEVANDYFPLKKE